MTIFGIVLNQKNENSIPIRCSVLKKSYPGTNWSNRNENQYPHFSRFSFFNTFFLCPTPHNNPLPFKRCYAPVKYRYSYASCICGKQSGILRILYSATQNSPVEFFPHSSEPVECGINRLPILPRQPYSQNGYCYYSYRREWVCRKCFQM